ANAALGRRRDPQRRHPRGEVLEPPHAPPPIAAVGVDLQPGVSGRALLQPQHHGAVGDPDVMENDQLPGAFAGRPTETQQLLEIEDAVAMLHQIEIRPVEPYLYEVDAARREA